MKKIGLLGVIALSSLVSAGLSVAANSVYSGDDGLGWNESSHQVHLTDVVDAVRAVKDALVGGAG